MSEHADNTPPDEAQPAPQQRAKLKAWRDTGRAFPNQFLRRHFAMDLHEKYEEADRDSMDLNPVLVKLAGRVTRSRALGKATVASLHDMTGTIELFFTDGYPGREQHTAFKQCDAGDIVGVQGVLFKTRSQELMVRVRHWHLLVKALRTMPQTFRRVENREPLYRQRYLDLIVNEDTRLRFVQRSRVIESLRSSLLDKRYLEVETPIMQPLVPGGTRKRLATHHNALDVDFNLRNAPDRYLKQLVIGGFEKVFEINRCFRDGDDTAADNPEVTLLKIFVAYRDHYYLMQIIEAELQNVSRAVLGSTIIEYQGRSIDLGKPFTFYPLTGAITQYYPDLADGQFNDRGLLLSKLRELGITADPAGGIGALQYAVFKHGVAPHLFQPTCVFFYPSEVSPCARPNDKYPDYAERFSIHVGGHEIAHGVSEINDPEDACAGACLTPYLHDGDGSDPDLVRALEYGMPPTASAGVDIDQLVMILTDSPGIKDVILFPLLRPQ